MIVRERGRLGEREKESGSEKLSKRKKPVFAFHS